MKRFACILFSLLLLRSSRVLAEDGYRLWLRYDRIDDRQLLQQYLRTIPSCTFPATGSEILPAARNELTNAIAGLLGHPPDYTTIPSANSLLIGTPASLPFLTRLHWDADIHRLGDEGFIIRTYTLDNRSGIAIVAASDKGVLYGVFQFIRLLQTHQPLTHLDIISIPTRAYRILDHWDNMSRNVERGYAGLSLWDWFTLPTYKDQRYTDYARANASIGINGAVLNNVNANYLFLTPAFLEKAAALADIFRPYGIRVYLSVNFASPIQLGGLHTADPLDPVVREWWKKKADEIYRYIPDFGGFLVKANSEGQPGPQNYGRSHADGANMMGEALAPHHGIVIWRAFVYNATAADRARQAYDEFHSLDGKFDSNVLVQIKNGPLDFQPREPFHPLFGAMPDTRLMLEVQITQEYLGASNHLVYLAPLFAECMDADTYTHGNGPTVGQSISGMAGVANTGNDINWCGHIFAQANWYAFGRLAWGATPAGIADEWIRQTFTNNTTAVDSIRRMMLASREITVDYMNPVGLNMIFAEGHHYGPGPWYDKAKRPDWNSTYYHHADSAGIGFDRTPTGSNMLEQYAPGARAEWEDVKTCPDKWLLWFHHVPWTWKMHSGRTLWDEMCYRYQKGVDSVRWMQRCWQRLRPDIDQERWRQVDMKLRIQEHDAVWWRNACLLYFQTFSRMPIPAGVEPPDHTLEYYEDIQLHDVPGTGR
ncbi:MAG TPA: alpha-glucuronidase family glycosyl hydrolase [Puia sp.]|nr:alpha-glucuronidase family glycosyl hydrolase [Puia sp.]